MALAGRLENPVQTKQRAEDGLIIQSSLHPDSRLALGGNRAAFIADGGHEWDSQEIFNNSKDVHEKEALCRKNCAWTKLSLSTGCFQQRSWWS